MPSPPVRNPKRPPYRIECTSGQSRGAKRGVVIFERVPSPAQWEAIRKRVSEMIENGFRTWDMDLRMLEGCTSEAIGMWLSLNVLIEARKAYAIFLLRRETNVFKIFRLMKIDRILAVHAESPSSDLDSWVA